MAAYFHVHLELAREADHPQGSAAIGYDLVVPLDDAGRIDANTWRATPGRSRVRRFREGETEAVGTLAHGPGGQWRFDFAAAEIGDDVGFRLQSETLQEGEYLSIRMSDGALHVFRVASVRQLAPM